MQHYAILSCLDESQYGLDIHKDLLRKNIQMYLGTMYDILRRLHRQSLVTLTTGKGIKSIRTYYHITAEGKRQRRQFLQQAIDCAGGE